jgi:transcriptional regulator with XRE-family HTH domain
MRLMTTRDVGAFIRDARRARGLTQAELADAAGVTRRWLSSIEGGGKPRAELGLILATLNALQVDLDASLDRLGEEQSQVPGLTEAPDDEGLDLDAMLEAYSAEDDR